MYMDDEPIEAARRALLREVENEIADLRAEKLRIESKLERLEMRRREMRERSAHTAPLSVPASRV